jgi:hypothetical protein
MCGNSERALSEIVQFISKADLERARLIEEARAMYESIFPQVKPVGQAKPKR